MKLNWIQTFIDICETKNFNRTADRLDITQSTVSSRIRALEELLDINLFVRGRGGASLTQEGERFITYAQNIRMNWNLALKELKCPKSYIGTVKIAVQVNICEQFVNDWLISIRTALPKTAIHIEAEYSKTMVEDFQNGDLDLAVMYAPKLQSNLEVEHLFNEKFVMIATEPMHIDQVNQENYIFIALTPYFEKRHYKLLPQLQFSAMNMGLSSMGLDYLKDIGGASYISETVAKELLINEEMFIVNDAPIIEQPIYVTYLSKHKNSYTVKEILTILRNLMRN